MGLSGGVYPGMFFLAHLMQYFIPAFLWDLHLSTAQILEAGRKFPLLVLTKRLPRDKDGHGILELGIKGVCHSETK